MKNALRLLLFALSAASPALAQTPCTLAGNSPPYGWRGLPGSIRVINVTNSGTCPTGRVNWTILSTAGNAQASFNGTGLTTISNAIGEVEVDIGNTAGAMTINKSPGQAGPYVVGSAVNFTVQATSVDNPSSTATFVFNVAAKTTATEIVGNHYRQVYSGDLMELSAVVYGDTNPKVQWSILSQPTGGDASLPDTTYQDTVFSATVSGLYTIKAASVSNPTRSDVVTVYVPPSSETPAYTSTLDLTPRLACSASDTSTTALNVGPGQTYSTINAALVALTGARSIVRVLYTATPYNEQPYLYTGNVTVCGIPSTNGLLPHVVFAGATSPVQTNQYLVGQGFTIAAGTNTKSNPTGPSQNGSGGPDNVSVYGLYLSDAMNGQTFTFNGPSINGSPSSGPTQTFVDAACIRDQSGISHTIIGNRVQNCAFGLFNENNTNGHGWMEATLFNEYSYNNVSAFGVGTAYPGGNEKDHGGYIQNFFGVQKGNYFHDPTPGMQGSALKIRGTFNVVAYNFFAGGTARDVDMVDLQDATSVGTLEGFLANSFSGGYGGGGDTMSLDVVVGLEESLYHDYGFGNILVNGGFHMGEDQGANQMNTRFGYMGLWSNTVAGTTIPFSMQTTAANLSFGRMYVANNTVWNASNTAVAATYFETQIMTFQTNFWPAGAINLATPIMPGNLNAGTAQGWASDQFLPTSPYPLAVPMETHMYGLTPQNFLTSAFQPYNANYVPTSGSPLNNGGSVVVGEASNFKVRNQYQVATHTLVPRLNALTIGANDLGPPPSQTGFTFALSPISVLVGGTATATCTAQFSDGTSQPCSGFTLSSSSPAATISGANVIGAAVGTANITMTTGSFPGQSIGFSVLIAPPAPPLVGGTTVIGGQTGVQ